MTPVSFFLSLSSIYFVYFVFSFVIISSASSGSSGHSWGSTSSGSDTVSLATEPSSELSHAHLAPPTVHHALSVSQVRPPPPRVDIYT